MTNVRWDPPWIDGRWSADVAPLSDRVRSLLEQRIGPGGGAGVASPTAAGSGSSSGSVPASRLDATELAALSAIVGRDGVTTVARHRVRRSHGLSYPDLMAVRSGSVPFVCDAVVAPSDGDQVAEVLAWCSSNNIAVVTFGGGTSVVGSVNMTPADAQQFSAVIALTTEAMSAVISVNELDHTVTVQPGITAPVLERLLSARGLTLGHFPQSFERATIGGYLATRSAGQASTGYGRIEHMVEALTVATPTGVIAIGRGPASAAGPDLLPLFIGSEGTFGVITSATLRVRPAPTVRHYTGYMLPSFEAGMSAFRALAQSGLTATVMRLSDEMETETTLAMSGPSGAAGVVLDRYLSARKVSGGALAILGWDGTDVGVVSSLRKSADRVLSAAGAVSLGQRVGRSWEKHRYEGPYTRDSLIDAGYFVETVESAASWSDLTDSHALMTSTLQRELSSLNPVVMAHVSHVYDTGASVYVTVVGRQPTSVDVWLSAKACLSAALVAGGFTISHHHAVGRDHKPFYFDEVGSFGVDILRAVKAQVDPRGVMNPGALL